MSRYQLVFSLQCSCKVYKLHLTQSISTAKAFSNNRLGHWRKFS